MNTNSNYPEHTQETAEYQGGYPSQPMPLQPYPPQQPYPMPYPQSQPLQSQQGYGQPMMPVQQPGYPQPMYYPPQQIQMPYQGYPQQMMMQPQPINVVVNTANTNNNVNTAMAGVGYVRVRRRNTPILLSIIYLCFIGYWLGPSWLVIALILNALGKESGQTMMKQLPMVFFLRQPLDRVY